MKKTVDKILTMVSVIAVIAYGISMAYLFYKQMQWVDGAVYESDLPAHISMVIEDGWYYSLVALIYKALFLLPWPDLTIAGFLSICGLLSVYLTERLLAFLQRRVTVRLAEGEGMCIEHWLDFGSVRWLAALALNLVMACYVKGFADGRYIGMQTSSIWHNSTYIVMKAAALGCLLCYLRIEESYREKVLSFGAFLGFAVMLAICTAVKPSFLVMFAPALLLSLLWDLAHGVPFVRLFVMGITVVPSLVVIVLQSLVLFGQETGNSFSLQPGATLSMHSGYPLVSAVLSILFPLAILGCQFCAVIWRKSTWGKLPELTTVGGAARPHNLSHMFLGNPHIVTGAWLMAAIGFLQLFLFSETGGRAGDGNFMWGYCFAILPIFIVSLCFWVWQMQRLVMLEGNLFVIRGLVLLGTAAIFLYHLYCGVYFYVNLVQGVSYWMWD